ncbi:nucleoredoxin [Thraustotheca clavata]|uniref:protein-disulfide reductase n=1 Tax=Thraustotheca clavata TaxID=74557 RepID=A0A1V9YV74_9STRA|nr:nucleoredoxin [Thraustotheca clavata]
MNKANRKLREIPRPNAGPMSIHVSIPLRPQERPTAFNEGFYSSILTEYATKYLEQLGAKSTRENINMVIANVPIDKCRVTPGWRSRGSIDDVLIIDTNSTARPSSRRELRFNTEQRLATNESHALLPRTDNIFGTDLEKKYRVGQVVMSFNDMKHRYLFPFNQIYKIPMVYDNQGFPVVKQTTTSRRVYKPSHIELSELYNPIQDLTFDLIKRMQEAFYRVIPFDMLNVRDQKDQQLVNHFLTSTSTLHLIGFLAHYIYWTVLRPLADQCTALLDEECPEYDRQNFTRTPLLSNAEIEMILVSLIEAFETLKSTINGAVRPKTTTQSSTPIMSLLMLSLRVSLATICRNTYPRWFNENAARLEPTLTMINEAIDKLLDPNQYYSHIGPLEATSDAINFTQTHAFKLQKRKVRIRGSFFSTSHKIQTILPEPSSGLPRRILTQSGGSSIAHYTSSDLPDTNMSTFVDLFGVQIQTKSGLKPTAEVFDGKTVVGIYFSAHWCPPCRGFTPTLSETYLEITGDDHKEFELVFVSSDRDEAGFDEYYSEMPFLALPYANREQKDFLAKKFEIRGIPTLVFVDAAGNTITKDGRSIITQARGDVSKIFADLKH